MAGDLKTAKSSQPLGGCRSVHAACKRAGRGAMACIALLAAAVALLAPCAGALEVTPPGATVREHDSIGFQVAVPATAYSYTFQWQRNGQPLAVGAVPSALSSHLILNSVQPVHAGRLGLERTVVVKETAEKEKEEVMMAAACRQQRMITFSSYSLFLDLLAFSLSWLFFLFTFLLLILFLHFLLPPSSFTGKLYVRGDAL